jgi:ABC-2 type transport system ATP-binding protein
MSVLSVKNVSHQFSSRKALIDVSLELGAGEFCVLLGKNGAGKTTLFGLLTSLYPLKHGHIEILKHDIVRERSRALAGVGAVFQELSLDLDLSVMENMRYYGGLHGVSPWEIDQRIAEDLARLGLSERRAERVRFLSGGLRRRAEIARALLTRPKLLLLDEPTVGLDASMRRAMLSHVRSIAGGRGVAVLWATHLLEEVQPSDTVVVIDEGRIVAAGTPRDLGVQMETSLENLLA